MSEHDWPPDDGEYEWPPDEVLNEKGMRHFVQRKRSNMSDPEKYQPSAAERRRKEILDQIEDPKVREHYDAQLRYAEKVEGIEAGGIFTVPGAPETQFVHTGLREEILLPSLTPEQQSAAEERRLVDQLTERERWEALGVQDVFQFHSKPPKRDLWLWFFATLSLTLVVYFVWRLLSK